MDILQYCDAHGLSVPQFARLVKLHFCTIYRGLETGNFTIPSMRRILSACPEISPDSLVKYYRKRTRKKAAVAKATVRATKSTAKRKKSKRAA